MRNTIIMWAMLVLLSFLTACGGSDSSGGNNFVSGSGEDDPQQNDPNDPDDDTPDIVDEDGSVIGLGDLSSGTYQANTARTGLGANESLSASGSTTVSVDIVDTADGNAVFSGVRDISFVSTCSSAGLAEFIPATIKASESATVTYKDKGCGRELGAKDAVVVYVEGESDNPSATARTTIDVEAAEISAIKFLSASPSLIALNGYGTESTPTLSTVTFQVLDRSGNPMPDRTVRFELDHEFGGASLSLAQAITGPDGNVDVILNAGSAAKNIRVKAAIDVKDANGNVTKTITTMSIPISMATSLADKNSFSLALSTQNPHAWDIDGTEVDVSVRVGDHNQNPVLDGTTVYFRASGGMIEPSCETSNGTCSVKWQSTNPRPVDGYVTIMAQTRGQGDYQDANSNGIFDVGEVFEIYPESYLDANGSGTYDPTGEYQPTVDIDNDGTDDFGWTATDYRYENGDTTNAGTNFFEDFVDSNNNGGLDLNPPVKYQGVNCSDAAIADSHCAELIDITASARLQMSQGNEVYLEGPFAWDSGLGRFDTSTTISCVDASFSGGAQYVGWRVADSESRRNKLPMGSSIGFDTDNVEVLISSGDGDVSNLPVSSTDPFRSGATPLTAQQKYEYLNARGHIIAASILRAESFTTVTGLGTIALNINTPAGNSTGGLLNVDLYGNEARLSLNDVNQTSIDVSGGSRVYRIEISNRCGTGLPAGSKLQLSLSNGTFDDNLDGTADSIVLSGGASAEDSSTASTAVISIGNNSVAVVDVEIFSDGNSDTAPNDGLSIYFVNNGTLYSLGDFGLSD